MTEPHLQGISIKDDIITTSCEKFSVDLDDYISCYSDEIKNRNMIDKFKKLNLNNSHEVKEYISEINNYINWLNVVNKLYDMEKQILEVLKLEESVEK